MSDFIVHHTIGVSPWSPYQGSRETGHPNFFGFLYQSQYSWVGCRNNYQVCYSNGIFRRRIEERKAVPVAFLSEKYNVGSFVVDDWAANVARWFWYIEGHMGWEERTCVHPTNINEHIMICPSRGWVTTPLHFSLFSLMCRVGPFCNHGVSMEFVFNKNQYTKLTKPALWQFLNGRQTLLRAPNQSSLGWKNYFSSVTDANIPRFLASEHEIAQVAEELWRNDGCKPNLDKHYWSQAIVTLAHRRSLNAAA